MSAHAVTGVRHVSKLTHPDLVVERYSVACKQRVVTIFSGVSPTRLLAVNDPDIRTLECALLERMYFYASKGQIYDIPEPPQVQLLEAMLPFTNKLLQIVRHSTPVSPADVPQMYSGRKRTIYSNALIKYNQTGLNRKHAVSKVFVKCEKTDPSKAPRCINPRDPVYNLILGTYIKPIEHRLYRAIAKCFGKGPVIMKGYNVQQVGRIVHDKWSQFTHPVAIGLDAARFDAHVSVPMLHWEHSIYMHIFRNCPKLRKLLSWQIDNKGVGYCQDGRLRFSVKGKRFSGDMNTALGNCLIMCGMVYSYSKIRDVEIDLLNNGDDCVVILEREHLRKFCDGLSEWFFDNCGFRMTIEEPVYRIQEIEFCQMHPILTSNGWTMVRNINTAREKDSICVGSFKNEIAWRKWLYAVGECGLACNSGVPIMQEMYSMMMRVGLQSNVSRDTTMQTGMSMLRIGLDSKRSVVTDNARLDVFLAWGFTPDEQRAIENHYRTIQLDVSSYRLSDLCDIPVTLM